MTYLQHTEDDIELYYINAFWVCNFQWIITTYWVSIMMSWYIGIMLCTHSITKQSVFKFPVGRQFPTWSRNLLVTLSILIFLYYRLKGAFQDSHIIFSTDVHRKLKEPEPMVQLLHIFVKLSEIWFLNKVHIFLILPFLQLINVLFVRSMKIWQVMVTIIKLTQ